MIHNVRPEDIPDAVVPALIDGRSGDALLEVTIERTGPDGDPGEARIDVGGYEITPTDARALADVLRALADQVDVAG